MRWVNIYSTQSGRLFSNYSNKGAQILKMFEDWNHSREWVFVDELNIDNAEDRSGVISSDETQPKTIYPIALEQQSGWPSVIDCVICETHPMFNIILIIEAHFERFGAPAINSRVYDMLYKLCHKDYNKQ